MLPKLLVGIGAAAVIIFLLAGPGDSGGNLQDTANYNQPPTGLSVSVTTTGAAPNRVTIAINGNLTDVWQWADPQNKGETVMGKLQALADCPHGSGRYSGVINFWTHKPGDDFVSQPNAGQPVLHRVNWSTSGCLPASMQVIVYSPDEY